jgi:hypothetical protein
LTLFSIQHYNNSLIYSIDGFVVYSQIKQISNPLHANFLLYSSGYCIENILFYQVITGLTGPQGAQGRQGETGQQGPKGETGQQGQKGETGIGIGIPPGGASGQVLVKKSMNDYDTIWSSRNDKCDYLESILEILVNTVKHLECRYDLLNKNKFIKFNPEFLTYSTLLRSYMNLIAVFDGGNADSDFCYGPLLDCGQGVEEFTDFVILIINAGYSKAYNFSSREASIQYLEHIYPDDCENDIILDGGNSASVFSLGPSIDCGNVRTDELILDGGRSSQLFEEYHPYIILDGGESKALNINSQKLDLGNSENIICN